MQRDEKFIELKKSILVAMAQSLEVASNEHDAWMIKKTFDGILEELDAIHPDVTYEARQLHGIHDGHDPYHCEHCGANFHPIRDIDGRKQSHCFICGVKLNFKSLDKDGIARYEDNPRT